MLKAVRLFIPIDMLVNPCFKITASFANVARTRNISLYSRKDFNSLGIGSS